MSRGLGAASLLASLLYTTCAFAQAPDALPPGEGRDIVAVACSQCHPITILRSLREGDQGWRQHINKMVLRGAQLTAAETDLVVD